MGASSMTLTMILAKWGWAVGEIGGPLGASSAGFVSLARVRPALHLAEISLQVPTPIGWPRSAAPPIAAPS